MCWLFTCCSIHCLFYWVYGPKYVSKTYFVENVVEKDCFNNCKHIYAFFLVCQFAITSTSLMFKFPHFSNFQSTPTRSALWGLFCASWWLKSYPTDSSVFSMLCCWIIGHWWERGLSPHNLVKPILFVLLSIKKSEVQWFSLVALHHICSIHQAVGFFFWYFSHFVLVGYMVWVLLNVKDYTVTYRLA